MGLFKVRRTTTPGLIPTGLTYGEMAVNLADRILYVGGTAENAIEIAGGSGNYRFYYQTEAPGLSQGFGITGITGQYDYLVGSRWVDSDTGREYIYIGDGDQWYWFEPAGGGGAGDQWVRPDPTTATDVAGIPAGTTGLVGESPIEILERILYPYQVPAFNTLSTGLGSEFELGQTAGNGSFTVSWTRNSAPSANWVPNSATYSHSGIVSGTRFTGVDPVTGTPRSVAYPAFKSTSLSNNTMTFTLSAQKTEGTGTPSISSQSRWWSRMYFGKSSSSNLLTPTFNVATGVNSSDFLRVSPSSNPEGPSNFNASVGAGDGFFYLFIHDSYTLNNSPPYFGLKFSGLALAQDGLTTVSITNSHGHTMTYKRYKSFERLNDPIVVIINASV